MIIVSVLAQREVDGQRRAKGRKITEEYALAVDNYQLILAHRTGSSPFQGEKFLMKLAHLEPVLKEFGLNVEACTRSIYAGFSAGLGILCKKLPTLAEMDLLIKPSEQTDDSTGTITLYKRLKEKFPNSGETVVILEKPVLNGFGE